MIVTAVEAKNISIYRASLVKGKRGENMSHIYGAEAT